MPALGFVGRWQRRLGTGRDGVGDRHGVTVADSHGGLAEQLPLSGGQFTVACRSRRGLSYRQLRDGTAFRLVPVEQSLSGVTAQYGHQLGAVLSLATPGVQNLPAADAVSVAREANDALADVVNSNPDRFQAFAAIPTPAPEAAAAELERAVTQLGFRGAMLYGRTGDKLADAPEFDDLYATAERLRVPLHFHPQTPVRGIPVEPGTVRCTLSVDADELSVAPAVDADSRAADDVVAHPFALYSVTFQFSQIIVS